MKYLIAAGLSVVLSSAYGQEKASNDTLKTEDVLIVIEFEPTIAGANKKNTEPSIDEVMVPDVTFDYNHLDRSYPTSFIPDTIKAANMRGEPLDKLYRAHLNLGIGNYLNTHGRLSLSSLRSKSNLWSLDALHDGSTGGINDVPYNGFSRQKVQGNFKHLFFSHLIDFQANYEHSNQYAYGMTDAFNEQFLEMTNDSARNLLLVPYQMISGKAVYESFFADSAVWNYKIGFKADHLRGLDRLENHFLLSSEWSKFYGDEQALVFFDFDYNDPLTGAVGQNEGMLVRIEPHIKGSGEKFRFDGGLSVWLENDPSGTTTRFFPVVNLEYSVVDHLLVPYAGLNGGIKRTNINALRNQNIYVDPTAALNNEVNRIDAFAGVRGAYSSTISFNFRASKQQFLNYATFVNDSSAATMDRPAESRFAVVYDTMNITDLFGEITYTELERVNFIWNMNYRSFDPTTEVKAWHQPRFKTALGARYDLRDKIVLKMGVEYASKRWARVYDAAEGEEVAFGIYGKELEGYFDLSLGVEYRYNRRVSAYLNVNNILNQNYEVWHRYPVQGINVLAGFTWSLWGE